MIKWISLFLLHIGLLFAKETKILHSSEEALRLALCHNRTVLMTRELLQKADWGVLESYTKWMPQLQAQSFYYETSIPQTPILDATSGFMTQLSLSQAVFSTKNYYGIILQKLYKQELNLIYAALINDLTYQVKSAYFRIIFDKQRIATTEERIALLSNLNREMKSRFDIGETIIYNVNQTKVALINATASYYQAEKDLKDDLDTLVRLIGYDPACLSIDVKGESEQIPCLASKLHAAELKVDETELIQKNAFFSQQEINYYEQLSNKQRPELYRAYTNYKIAVEEINKKRGTYLPSIDAFVNYGGEPAPWCFNAENSFFHQSMAWGAGLQLNWLLFDSFGRELSIWQLEAAAKAANFKYQDVMQKVHQEVRSQIWSIEEALTQFAFAKSNVTLAEEMVEQAKDQFQVGYINVFDFEIAVNELAEARLIRDRSSYSLLVSYYGLLQATGSLKNGCR
jgi:outer membrane protein